MLVAGSERIVQNGERSGCTTLSKERCKYTLSMTLQNHYFVNRLLKCECTCGWGAGGREMHTGVWRGNLKGKKPVGRSGPRCGENIKMDHKPDFYYSVVYFYFFVVGYCWYYV